MSTLDISANATTMRVIELLNYYGKDRVDRKTVDERLSKLLKADPKSTFLVHLSLFLHLDLSEVNSVLENDHIYPFIPSGKLITPELYMELVSEHGLYFYFIHMVATLKDKEFARALLTASVVKIEKQLQDENFQTDSVIEYILVLAQLSRGETEPFFSGTFDAVLNKFLGAVNKDAGTKEKLALLLRLAGTLCMKDDDYEGDSEIAELSKNFFYAPSKGRADNATLVYETIFEIQKNPEDLPVGIAALTILNTVFSKSPHLISVPKEESDEWINEKRLPYLSWLEFLGGCGYLAHSLLKKYEAEIDQTGIGQLLLATSNWAKFRPKYTYDDFKDEIRNFPEFLELFSIFGRSRRYQKDWFQALLAYPEMFMNSTALQLLDTLVVPNADTEFAYKLTKITLDLNPGLSGGERLPERVREVILSLLRSPGVKRDELVKQVFESGVHSTFARNEFKLDLAEVCIMVRTMQNAKLAVKREKYEDAVYTLIFQNPLEALESLLTVSLRSHYFKPLQWAKVFLSLPPPKTEAVTLFPTTGQLALFNLLSDLKDMDPILDFISIGLPLFIADGLLTFSQVYETVLKVVDTTLKEGDIRKVVRLFEIYKKLVIEQLGRSEVVEPVQVYVKSILGFTYIMSRPPYFVPIMSIREHCLELLDFLKSHYKQPDDLLLSPEELEKGIEDESDGHLGLKFIRTKEFRPTIHSYFIRTKNSSDSDSDFWDLVSDLGFQVNNSCRLEWEDIVQYWLTVVYPNRPVLHTNGLVRFLADAVAGAFKMRGCRSGNFLAFFAHFLLELEKDPELSPKPEEQLYLIKVLISIILELYKDKEKGRQTHAQLQVKGQLFQQAMLVILEFVEWIVQDGANDGVKEPIRKYLATIPETVQWPSGQACLPIYSTILDRLKDGRVTSMAQPKTHEMPAAAELLKQLANANLDE